MRRRLQGVRREVHVEPSAVGQATDALPGVQEAGAEGSLHVQFAEAGFDFGCQEGRVHGAEARQQGRVRAAVGLLGFGALTPTLTLNPTLNRSLNPCPRFEIR